MKLWRILSVGLSVGLGVGCSANEDIGLAITGVAALEANCDLPGENPDIFRSAGTFDPRVGTEFLYTPVVTNQLTPTSVDNQAVGANADFFPEANRINLLGFDVCYVRADDNALTDLGSNRNGFPLDCEADGLPGEFIGASGGIDPGGGSFITAVSVFGPAAQKALFGDAFEPTQLPSIGESMDGSTLSFAPVPATETNRDPNWGNFPAADSVQVYILVRAVGLQASGGTVQSEYVTFRVDVFPGFANRFCGDLVATICPDASAGFAGRIPDAASSCSVASALSIGCTDFTTCPN